MAKVVEKAKARTLRRKGISINKIATQLGVSKGSVSLWCDDIVLTSAQKEVLEKSRLKGGYVGRMKGARMNKEKRLKVIIEHNIWAEDEIGKLTKRDLLMLGIGLYWGEGVKGERGSPASMVNSDPEVIRVSIKWFKEVFGIKTKDFRPYIYISEVHRQREEKIMDYWVSTLKIPKKQFLQIIFLKSRPKKKYENYNSYYGILALRIRRSSTLKYKILGLINACKQ